MVPSTMMWKYSDNLSFCPQNPFNFSPFLSLAHSGCGAKKAENLDWIYNYDILQIMLYQYNGLGTSATSCIA